MDIATSTKDNLMKCGEITAALTVDKKIFSLHCGFCSRVFIKLHAFTLHVTSKHELELFGCVQDESCENDDDIQKEDISWNEEDSTAIAIEDTFSEMKKEGAPDFPDPLEQLSLNLVSEEIQVLGVKDEVERMEHEYNNDDDDDDYADKKDDDADILYDSSETEVSSESDNEEDNLVEDDETPVNNELTLAIITELEKHRILWDANKKPMWKTRRQRIKTHETIATTINKQLGINLKWNAIRDRIKKLCSKFRSEVQKQKRAESKCLDYTPIWYYDKLSFLNESIKYKQQSTEIEKRTLAGALRQYEVPLPNLTDTQNLEIIEIYKSFPCLWDVHHIEFRFTNRRREAMNEMIEKVQTKMNLNLTRKELHKLILSICNACRQEKTRNFRCERLKKKFVPMCKFYEQICFLNDNVGPFKCDFCEETFNGPDQYKMHKSKHDGSMPFTCPICNRGFMKVGNCTLHLRRHTRDYPFECKVCKKRYPTSNDVNIHMRGHTGEKPYFCEICGQSYRTWTLFDNHTRRHQKRPSHICTICSKGFYEKPRFTEHMNVHLNIRNVMCNVCGKSFTSGKYLRQHKQIHAEKKKYVCRICKKDFAQYAGLSGHMKSHGTTITGNSIMVEDSQ